MADTITDKFADVYRDYVTAGVPASGENKPRKSDIRALGGQIDSAITELAAAFVADSAVLVYAARATLYANLAPSPGALGIVYNDGANNGIYIKVGAGGTGSWTATGLMLSGATGADGKSFYQIALDTGYVPPGTTEEDFVNAVALAVSAAAAADLAPIVDDLNLGADGKLAINSVNMASIISAATNMAAIIAAPGAAATATTQAGIAIAAAASIGNAGKLVAQLAVAGDVVQVGSDIVATEKRSVGSDAYAFVATTGHANFLAGSVLYASWSAAHRGMSVPVAGQLAQLYEVELPAGIITGVGAIIYIGIVRPTAPLPLAVSTSLTTNTPRFVGKIDLSAFPSQTLGKVTWRGTPVDYQAGDLLCFWGPNVQFQYGTNTGANPPANTAFNGQYHISLTIANNNETGLGSGFTTSSSSALRQIPYVAKVAAGPVRAGLSGPASYVVTDNFGHLPEATGSPAEFPLLGKRGALTGSSISTDAGGGSTTEIGHLPIGMAKLGAGYVNYAVGGSFVCWAPTATGTSVENKTIGATAVELTARFGGSFAQYSYENLIVGKGFDFIVLPDGMNDTNLGAFTIGTFTGSFGDPATLYGVYRRMIEAILTAEPGQRIFLQSPMHPWATYGGSGAPTEQANRRQWRDAMLDLADKYSLAGVLDYIRYAGCSSPVVAAGQGLFDTIHPTQLIKTTAGQRVVFSTMRRG